ncbi:MAG TPA: SPFH domain-containing protein [Lachnospiraceae bacterium]
MGLIRALIDTAKGTFADQWKEYIYCDSLDSDVLVKKGQKKTKGNNKGSDNIITNGSMVVVNEGQCMMIVDQGKVVDLCANAGAYQYDASTEPSIFTGDLSDSLANLFATMGKRFSYGGDTGNDQRVYYFNTKEIMGNKYGTQNPVPFRVVDANIGLDIDISIRCNGEYSYKIVNPILFYSNVCGNVDYEYHREEIDSTLKMELLTALQPAFAKISALGIRYSALPGHTMELSDALNEVLSKKWAELRGIEIASIGMNSVTASKEDEDMIKELQRTAVSRNPGMAAATLVQAQADAMRNASSNSAGAFTGFMGMNMANQAGGGFNAQNLFAMQEQAQMARQGQATQEEEIRQPKAQAVTSEAWDCSCGAHNTGKFCTECGKAKPTGEFQCDKCGWKPQDTNAIPKFCPECGDPFNEADRK